MRKVSLVVVFAIAIASVITFATPQADAQGARLFGLIGGFQAGGQLIEINPANGALINNYGTIGGSIERFTGMVIHQGVVYAMGSDHNNDGTGEWFLYSFDLSSARSGAQSKTIGTLVANIGVGPGFDSLPDLMKKNGSKGLRLYGAVEQPNIGGQAGVIKIKKNAGFTNEVGGFGTDDDGVCGAMNDKNKLHMIVGSDSDGLLLKVNKKTGAASTKASITWPSGQPGAFERCAAADFYPGNNSRMYVSVFNSWGSNQKPNRLAYTETRGPNAGVMVNMGSMPPTVDAIAFWR